MKAEAKLLLLRRLAIRAATPSKPTSRRRIQGDSKHDVVQVVRRRVRHIDGDDRPPAPEAA
jgi:hypothetical protein